MVKGIPHFNSSGSISQTQVSTQALVGKSKWSGEGWGKGREGNSVEQIIVHLNFTLKSCFFFNKKTHTT
jgi:hypothetical protein